MREIVQRIKQFHESFELSYLFPNISHSSSSTNHGVATSGPTSAKRWVPPFNVLPSAMAAVGLLRCLVSEGMVLDDFAVALLKACFEGWVLCSKRRDHSSTELKQLRDEIAKVRSELVESQRVSAFNEARVKQLEHQLATEEEWNFETVRFCQSTEEFPVRSVASSMASPLHRDTVDLLEQVTFERDQAMVEREQLRLELTAMQLVSHSQAATSATSPRLGSPRRSPQVLTRAQLAAATRQLQDCCMGLAPTGCNT